MPDRPPDKDCPRCGRKVPFYNEHCYSCGYDYPRPDEAAETADDESLPVVVWSYPGRTQADAAVLFQDHARGLAVKGYRPVSQSWAEGRPGVGRVLALGLYSQAIRPKGFLTVTYQLVSPSDALGTPSGADPIDQIRRLGELRDEGLISEDEYQHKKAELLSRL